MQEISPISASHRVLSRTDAWVEVFAMQRDGYPGAIQVRPGDLDGAICIDTPRRRIDVDLEALNRGLEELELARRQEGSEAQVALDSTAEPVELQAGEGGAVVLDGLWGVWHVDLLEALEVLREPARIAA